MPNYPEADRTELVFRAIADSRRRAMIERLVEGPATVSELAAGVSLPTVLQHLGVLEDAGIVTSNKIGRTRSVAHVPGALATAGTWISAQRTPAERQADRLVYHLDHVDHLRHVDNLDHTDRLDRDTHLDQLPEGDTP